MRQICASIIMVILIQSVIAQTAKQYITLEHFTNTLCSVCKNNNPSLFNNLNNNPGEVHHLAIHPVIPYPSCIFYQHNTAGNNYRRDLYGNIFGTPTTMANGTIKGVGASNLLPQSLIDNNRNTTSPLRIQVSETQNGNMLNITVRVKTYRPISNPNLNLFVAVAEQYIPYNAPNGENNHYHVFRAMLPANGGEKIVPAPVGQEVVRSFSIVLNGDWNPAEVYAMAFVQDTSSLEIINSGTRFDLILDANITPEDCAHAGNGAINLMVSGGMPPYSYNWSNGATTATTSGLNAGNYTVTVSDAGDFEYVDSISISTNSTLQSNITYTPATAGNGTATVSVTGGAMPYTYLWSNGQTTPTATGLPVGYISVLVTDDNGCTISDSIYVSMLSITADVKPASCFGDSDGLISLTISGGIPPYAFNWSNGSQTDSISSLAAGNYAVTITDSNNNDFEGSYTITQPNPLAATTTTTGAGNGANNGDASVQVTGGTMPYTYLWSNGATMATASQLAQGTYTVTITDANGCELVTTAVIAPPTGIFERPEEAYFFHYPNPANNQMIIEVSEPVEWKVFNLTGALIIRRQLDAGATNVNLGHLAPGIYLQQVVAPDGKTATDRLVISR